MDSTVVSPAGREASEAPRPLRILVVDDNPDSADMLAMSLRMMGHDVRALYDPLEVLACAIELRPDIAFLDVGMPVLNGYALAAQLRDQQWPGDRRPRLVALTGWGRDEDRRRSEDAGFDDHLVKPADLDLIESVCLQVSAALKGSRSP